MNSRHGGTLPQGLSDYSGCCAFDGIYACFCRRSRSFKPGTPGAKQPHAQHGGRRQVRIRVSAAGESESGGRNLLSDIPTGRVVWRYGGRIGPCRQHSCRDHWPCWRALPPTASGAILARYRRHASAGMSRDDYATRKVAGQLIRDRPQVGIQQTDGPTAFYLRYLGPQGQIVDVEAVSKRTGRLTRCQRFPVKRRRWQVRP